MFQSSRFIVQLPGVGVIDFSTCRDVNDLDENFLWHSMSMRLLQSLKVLRYSSFFRLAVEWDIKPRI